MPVPAAVPRDLSYAPFRGSDAVAGGLLTPAQMRSRQWRRLFRNICVSSDVPLDHRIRCLAADLFLDGRGAISGRSATGRPVGHARGTRAVRERTRALAGRSTAGQGAGRVRRGRGVADGDPTTTRPDRRPGCLGRSPSTGVNALRAGGWTVLRFGAADVYRRPRHVIATVRAALTTPMPG